MDVLCVCMCDVQALHDYFRFTPFPNDLIPDFVTFSLGSVCASMCGWVVLFGDQLDFRIFLAAFFFFFAFGGIAKARRDPRSAQNLQTHTHTH